MELNIYKNEIINHINKGLVEDAKQMLQEYRTTCDSDMDIYILEAMISIYEKKYKIAEKILLDVYDKYELNFDVNYTLGIISKFKKKYNKAMEYFLLCLTIDRTKEDIVKEEIQLISRFVSDEVFTHLNVENSNKCGYYFRNFPVKNDGSTYIANDIQGSQKSNHILGIYDCCYEERDNLSLDINKFSDMRLTKTEILKANRTKKIKMKISYKSVMPIMKLSDKQNITMKINKKEYSLDKLLLNRYYYYPIEESSEVEVYSEEEFVVGEIIELKNNNKKPKLLLNILVDGLSQKYIEDYGLEKSMPNIYKFFKEGTILNNCYSTGDWTYVSMASMYTGLYTARHRLFHNMYNSKNLYNHKLFTETINENGYFTCKIDGSWRSLPSSGYVKGIDRYLYQYFSRGMHCEDIITDLIEHLEAFKTKNNYAWIALSDLHDVPDQFEPKLSGQIFGDIDARIEKKSCTLSVEAKHSEGKVKNYGIQLKRIDTYLGLLFSYIKENYDESEFIVSLTSDHGQNFIYNTEEFLDEQRTKVPMMWRGKGVNKQINNELVSTLDLFPILFNLLGISEYEKNDTNIPKCFGGDSKRAYTYSETLHPNRPYLASINDDTHKFYFKSVELVGVDGRLKLDEYDVNLINRDTGLDETEKYMEKVMGYCEIVLENIREYIIY